MAKVLVDRTGGQVKRECIIVDMDGTLADCSHRRHFMENRPKDWKSFYGGMAADKINRWCRYLIQSRSNSIEVVIVTGRPEEYRKTTEFWLDTHLVSRSAVFMRKTGDYRQDAVVKEEILKSQILSNWVPFFAIDDRKQVVEMWRRNGIVTLQCDEGNF